MRLIIAKVGNDPAVEFAAEELKRCLTAMEPQLEIAVLAFADHNPALKGLLWLGICPRISSRVKDPELDDAYCLDVVNGVGAIRGSNGRSVLFGVYRYLKELGCTWVRPGADGEFIPKRTLEDTRVHVDETASYRHRGICIEGSVGYCHVSDMIDWMPKKTVS